MDLEKLREAIEIYIQEGTGEAFGDIGSELELPFSERELYESLAASNPSPLAIPLKAKR